MFAALALARDILSLGSAAAPLISGLVRLVRGASPETQRRALDAAYAAAEESLARAVHGGRS